MTKNGAGMGKVRRKTSEVKNMRKIIKFGFGILAVMVVLAGLWTYHTPELYEGFYRSVYSYRVTIETDSVLHNATLYLPLPVFAGESKVGDEIVAGNDSQPDDWNYSIVETEHGMMLAISMGELIPEFRSLSVPKIIKLKIQSTLER